MKTLIYAGIGSRATPESILADMTKMATWLARTGWHLASGGAHGADTAFAGGAPAGQRTLYLPWPGYNGHVGPDCHALSRSALSGIAWRLPRACIPPGTAAHPPPGSFTLGTQSILLSSELDRPVDAVVAWTRDSAVTGGTGMGLRIAAEHGIPVMNLGAMSPREACERLLAIRRSS